MEREDGEEGQSWAVELTPEQRRGGGEPGRQPAGVRRRRLRQDQGAGGAAVRLYRSEERCRIDDFLIITYTKAAAAELRGRIAAELSQAGGAAAGEHAPAPPDDAGVSGGHQNGGRLLRERCCGRTSTCCRRRGSDSPDAGFPGAGSSRRRSCCGCGCWSRILEEFYQRIGRGIPGRNSWRRRWAPGGMTGRWSGWCWSIHGKIQSHAYPHAVAGAAAGAVAAGCRSLGGRLTPGGAGRTASCGGPGSGRGQLTETAAWMEQ